MGDKQRKTIERDRRGGKADLHLHTLYSDGTNTPVMLVQRAHDAGLSCISITDHDTIGGIPEAMAAGLAADIEIIPGIELSALLNGREIHIIGYFIDLENRRLQSALSRFRHDRQLRAQRIVDRLNKLNVPLTIESVMKFAGVGAVGRPHIARAMVDAKLVDSYYQAFARYISDYGPAYERKTDASVEEILQLIDDAGGLSVLAHPGKTMTEDDVLFLIRAGIDGIEVIHPSHTIEMIEYYRGIVNQYYLIETGGSDYHGGLKGDEQHFGGCFIPAERVTTMEQRLPNH